MLDLALFCPFSSLPAILLKCRTGLGACLLSILTLAFLSSCMGVKSPPGPILSDRVKTVPFALVRPDAATWVRVNETYGRLPLSFEANQGQTDKQVKFLSRGSGYTLFLTSTEAVLALKKPQSADQKHRSPLSPLPNEEVKSEGEGTVLRMKLVGANPMTQAVGLEELPGKSNYFIGNDSRKWRTNVPNYAKVEYQEVFPGVNLVYYGNQRQLEYDFVVTPGADPKAIKLSFEGAQELHTDTQGNLVLQTGDGEVNFQKPLVYQEINGTRREIPGRYEVV